MLCAVLGVKQTTFECKVFGFVRSVLAQSLPSLLFAGNCRCCAPVRKGVNEASVGQKNTKICLEINNQSVIRIILRNFKGFLKEPEKIGKKVLKSATKYDIVDKNLRGFYDYLSFILRFWSFIASFSVSRICLVSSQLSEAVFHFSVIKRCAVRFSLLTIIIFQEGFL